MAEGGEFAVYTPIFQDDNAGPHKDAVFMKFVTDHCEARAGIGNLRHLKYRHASQMPHANVLDLSVHDATFKRRIRLVVSEF